MKIRTLSLLVITGLILALAMGCGPKPIGKESLLDTPDNHYNQGMREYDRGRLDAATEEFTRATALDPEYPGGYVGTGLVLAKRGDYRKAMDMVEKGLGKDETFIDGHAAKGQIIVMEKKGDKWLEDALKVYDKALKLKPNSEKILFYKGIAYKEAYEFRSAEDVFADVVAMKGDFAKKANTEWELAQKIQRAAPGTKIGAKIALIDEIDRADLAVLFIEEMKLLDVLKRTQPKMYDTRFRPPEDATQMQTQTRESMAAATDLTGHWAKNWIEDVVKAGAMDVFPDHTFRPDDKLVRSNYAMFLQNIIIAVTADQSLATKYFGTPSRFPDVNPTHFAYNAICLAVDRGIMKADTIEGTFGPTKTISGADALLIIRDFQNALRMTF